MDKCDALGGAEAMKNRVRLLSDASLLVMLIVATILMSAAITIILAILSASEPDPRDPFVRGMFIVMYVVYLIAFIAAIPRTCVFVTFTPEEIQLKVPYKKAEVYSYKQFCYIYLGGYFHGNIFGIGKNVYYIVFARRWMSTDELYQINQEGNSQTMFKIRYSKKTYDRLCEVLPSSSSFALQAAFRVLHESQNRPPKRTRKRKRKKR